MNWSTIGYVVTVLIAFVLAAAIMESTLDIYGAEALGYTMIVLVVVTVSDIIRKRIERIKARLVRMNKHGCKPTLTTSKRMIDEMRGISHRPLHSATRPRS